MKAALENNKQTQNHSIYDVVISGAGPVGLFLACELALAGCSVLILEKSENPDSPLKKLPFGIRGLSAPTIEALYRRGLLDELELHKRLKSPHQNAKEGAERQAGHFAGIPFLEGNIDYSKWKYRLESSTELSLISEINELEKVFSRRAASLGVEIKYGSAVTDFHETETGVTIESHGIYFQGKWLVGCDGSRSTVRKKGGFEFAGTEPEFTGYTVKADLADPEKLKPGRNITARGMYMQSQPGYLMIQDFDNGTFHSLGKPAALEHVQEILRRISDTDVTISFLHAASTWTDRARQAADYRKGRVFLAGDAAHIHSPLGGQGLNLGLGDAVNLGWKLAAVIQNKAPENLLESYYNERYPIGAQILDWSRAQVVLMKPDPNARALHAIIRDIMNTHDGATYFAGRVWGIHNHYNLGNGHPLAGRSIPNFELEDGTKIGELMHDGKGILLDFDGNSSIKSLADEYGGQIKYVSGRAKEQLGLSALLVRPDGVVAWVSDNNPDYSELQKAADRWFIRNSEAEH